MTSRRRTGGRRQAVGLLEPVPCCRDHDESAGTTELVLGPPIQDEHEVGRARRRPAASGRRGEAGLGEVRASNPRHRGADPARHATSDAGRDAPRHRYLHGATAMRTARATRSATRDCAAWVPRIRLERSRRRPARLTTRGSAGGRAAEGSRGRRGTTPHIPGTGTRTPRRPRAPFRSGGTGWRRSSQLAEGGRLMVAPCVPACECGRRPRQRRASRCPGYFGPFPAVRTGLTLAASSRLHTGARMASCGSRTTSSSTITPCRPPRQHRRGHRCRGARAATSDGPMPHLIAERT